MVIGIGTQERRLFVAESLLPEVEARSVGLACASSSFRCTLRGDGTRGVGVELELELKIIVRRVYLYADAFSRRRVGYCKYCPNW